VAQSGEPRVLLFVQIWGSAPLDGLFGPAQRLSAIAEMAVGPSQLNWMSRAFPPSAFQFVCHEAPVSRRSDGGDSGLEVGERWSDRSHTPPYLNGFLQPPRLLVSFGQLIQCGPGVRIDVHVQISSRNR